MKHSPVCLAATTLTLALLCGIEVRADLIPWTYNPGTTTFKTISANGSTGGSINLTSISGSKTSNPGETKQIPFAFVTYHSTASAGGPLDQFTNKHYSMTLDLQDSESTDTGTLTFTGTFNGTLSATQATITQTFKTPLTQTLTLGDYLYSVTIGPFVSLPISNLAVSGLILADVTVSPVDLSPGAVEKVPEPSTLVLASLTVPLLGLAAWRKRKRNATPAPA